MGPVRYDEVRSKRAARFSCVASLVALAVVGCNDPTTLFVSPNSGLERDGSVPAVDGGLSNAPTPPQPPAPPDLPRWTCPAGWTISGTPPETACEPWGTAYDTCLVGELRTPGSSGCEPLGDPCPAGDFAEPRASDGPAWFVRPRAAGNGTRDQPFGSVAAALAQAQTGDAIFLARGSYTETVQLARPVTLVGACAAATTFEVPATVAAPTLAVASARVRLRGIGVRGGSGVGLLVEASGDVHGEGLLFDQISGIAVAVEGGAAELTQLHVRDSGAGEGTDAAGLRVRQGGSLTLDHALIEGSRLHGVLALDDATEVSLRDLAIRGTRQEGARLETGHVGFGGGLWVGLGARGTLERAAIETNGRLGIAVTARAFLAAADVVVRDSVPFEPGDWGEGIFVEAASLDLQRALLDRNTRSGLRVDERITVGPAPVVTLTDVIIRGTQPRPEDGRLGNGLKVTSPDARTVDERAVLTGTRLLVEDNHRAGISSDDATVTLTDVTVRGTRASPADSNGGVGLLLSGGTAEVTRALISENRDAGVFVDTPDTTVSLTDVAIVDTESRDGSAVGGRGLYAVAGTTVELRRARLERNRETAIAIYGPLSRLTLEDVSIRDTYGRPGDGRFGAGLTAEATEINGARLSVERSRQVGVWIGRGSAFRVSELSVRDTLPQDCAESGCPAFGIGVGAYQRSDLALDGFEVVGATLCGVQIAAEGALDLVRGTVSRNVFGVCLGTEVYDINRLTQAVVYRENTRNIEAANLPIPEPSPPLTLSAPN